MNINIKYNIYPAEIEQLCNNYNGFFRKDNIIKMYEAGLEYTYIKRMIELYLHQYKCIGYSEEYFLQLILNINPIEVIYKIETTKEEYANTIKREPVPNSKTHRIQNKNKKHY